jgi:hypothetical protein
MGEVLGGGGKGACWWRCNARRSRKQRWPEGRRVAEEGGARCQAAWGRSGVRAGRARGVSWLGVWAREVGVGAGAQLRCARDRSVGRLDLRSS